MLVYFSISIFFTPVHPLHPSSPLLSISPPLIPSPPPPPTHTLSNINVVCVALEWIHGYEWGCVQLTLHLYVLIAAESRRVLHDCATISRLYERTRDWTHARLCSIQLGHLICISIKNEHFHQNACFLSLTGTNSMPYVYVHRMTLDVQLAKKSWILSAHVASL